MAVVLLALPGMALPGMARADVPGLAIVQPEAVAVTAGGATSSAFSVWVRNDTGDAVAPTFGAAVENGDHAARSVVVDVVDGESEIDAGAVERYRLQVATPSTQRQDRKPRADLGKLAGQLFVGAGGVAPGTVGLTIATEPKVDVGVAEALWIPAVFALILMAVATVLTLKDDVGLGTPLPSDLDFSTSYATKLTAVGALFGTFVSAGVLPEDTIGLSKAAFVALNLVFGVAIVVAGLLYAGLQRPVWETVAGDASKQQRRMQGQVWSFLVSCYVTVWAVLGELLTLWLLFDELGTDQGFGGAALWIVRGLVLVALLVTAIYTWRRVPALAQSTRPTKADTGPLRAEPVAVGEATGTVEPVAESLALL
ncbi:hypothetical protein DSM104299_02558 [Baekduia alba]|nr:hypothetical protein DSM104299_02558 [Baekduia alba]